MKTDDGWKRILNPGGEEIFSNKDHEYTSKKRKKDHVGRDAGTQCFYREKWIYVHKESTRERHGYCTLGEAFNRLDFASAVQDTRRFNYVVRLLQLIAKSQLTSLSGAAQKNYFNILDKIVQKVLADHHNPRLIKDLLRDLSTTLCPLVRGVGKSLLVGSMDIWACRLETVLAWQRQLQDLQMTKVSTGLTLSDLPLHTLNNILYRLSDGWDVVTLGQVSPTLHALSEDRQLWKTLCQYHFAEKQFCRHLILSEKGHVEWKLMYFVLRKHYPPREQYADTLHFCRHCSILFWKDCRLALLLKDSGHPCTAADPASCFTPVSPQHFIDLFKF